MLFETGIRRFGFTKDAYRKVLPIRPGLILSDMGSRLNFLTFFKIWFKPRGSISEVFFLNEITTKLLFCSLKTIF